METKRNSLSIWWYHIFKSDTSWATWLKHHLLASHKQFYIPLLSQEQGREVQAICCVIIDGRWAGYTQSTRECKLFTSHLIDNSCNIGPDEWCVVRLCVRVYVHVHVEALKCPCMTMCVRLCVCVWVGQVHCSWLTKGRLKAAAADPEVTNHFSVQWT